MRITAPSKFLLVTAALVIAVAGCGGDSDTPTEPTASTEAGSDTVTGGDTGAASARGLLMLRMVDAPTDEICELHVYIRDLRVKPDGQPQMLLGTDLGDFDLLALRDGPPAVLGDFPVDQGRYQFIEILLDQDRSYVIEKDGTGGQEGGGCRTERSALQVPSSKFKVNGGPFEVDASTTVTIDFDAGKSLKKKGGSSGRDQGWQLNPDVSITAIAP